MQNIFDYLIEVEERDYSFRFDRTSDNGMVVSYTGYKHMNLAAVVETLIKEHGLKFDFDRKGDVEEFDEYCGRTFVYFRNVYNQGGE